MLNRLIDYSSKRECPPQAHLLKTCLQLAALECDFEGARELLGGGTEQVEVGHLG